MLIRTIARNAVVATLAGCAAAALGASQASASIIGVSLGTGAPPAMLGSYAMTPFAEDGRPHYADVTTVPSPLGGDLVFDIAVSHREIGSGWATWSHGYTEDVYWTKGATTLTITLPALTGAFYFYAEPNPFQTFGITATTGTGESVTQDVTGDSGAAGYGFHATAGDIISTITVSSTVDFAVGEFGIAEELYAPQPVTTSSSAVTSVPEPATLALFGFGLAGMGAMARRRKPA